MGLLTEIDFLEPVRLEKANVWRLQTIPLVGGDMLVITRIDYSPGASETCAAASALSGPAVRR
jgi:hypothetical protein